MNISTAIGHLAEMYNLAEKSESAIMAHKELNTYVQNTRDFNSDVHGGNFEAASRWLKAWGRSPSTFMWVRSGNYRNFLEFKYHLRRGNKADDIAEQMDVIMREAFRDPPKGLEYHFQTPLHMVQDAEY